MKKKKKPRSPRRKFILVLATIALAFLAIWAALYALEIVVVCLIGDSPYNHYPYTPDGAREEYIPIPWYGMFFCPGSFDSLR